MFLLSDNRLTMKYQSRMVTFVCPQLFLLVGFYNRSVSWFSFILVYMCTNQISMPFAIDVLCLLPV